MKILKSLFKNIFYFNVKIKPIKKEKLPSFSYGKFLLENPTANKEERRKAIKNFLDTTRNTK